MPSRSTTNPVSRRVLVGIAVAFALTTVLAQFELSWLERGVYDALTGFDGWWEAVLAWVQPAGTLFMVVVGALLVAIYNKDHAQRLVLAGAITWVATQVAKAVVGRPRPDVLLGIDPSVVLDSPGYPSGHTAVVTSLVVALWPDLYRGERVVAVVLAVLVALGRMELGVHFPLDIAGGALLGALVALAVRAVLAGSRG